MIAELNPYFYDVHGKRQSWPGRKQRRAGFRPTLPLGGNLTHPLKVKCANMEDVRLFLHSCRHRSDERRHRKDKYDHWQPPQEFEVSRTGDCVDFALWVWRQLLDMGYAARFTGGKSGKFGEGHAWVTFEKEGKFYLVEPQLWPLGLRMPRLSTLRYHPSTSVAWDGKKISYYEHEDRRVEPPFRILPQLVAEWLFIYARAWLRAIPRVPLALARKVLRRKE
jgi:hypothetical protein